MPRDLILHIGTSKTGSTSIQKVLARQRRALRTQGIVYPRSPGSERHELLAVWLPPPTRGASSRPTARYGTAWTRRPGSTSSQWSSPRR